MVIIDGPDSWAKELVTEKIAEKFYGIDFTDESTIFDRCLAEIKEAEKVIAHDFYYTVGGLSGLLCPACMAICWLRLLQARHVNLEVESGQCIPVGKAVHHTHALPTCSLWPACLRCTFECGLVLNA